MRLLVCGGREYQDGEWVYAVLDRIHSLRSITLIIEGEATGADALTRAWARSGGVPLDPHPILRPQAAGSSRQI